MRWTVILLLFLLAALFFVSGSMLLFWLVFALGELIGLVSLAGRAKKATVGVARELSLGIKEEVAASKPAPPDARVFAEMSEGLGKTAREVSRPRKTKKAEETNVSEALGQGSKNFLGALKRIFK